MAIEEPKQDSNYQQRLAGLVNGFLAERGWSPAKLAIESLQSKATISRIVRYQAGNKNYRPSRRAIQAIALALKLSVKESQKLFDTAFPEELVWREAIERHDTVDDANRKLYTLGLPQLITTK